MIRGLARILLPVATLSQFAFAQLPPNFVDEVVSDGYFLAVGHAFAADGRLFVWEKQGIVYFVEPGQPQRQTLIDIREEVGDWRDYGLLGFALDPNFYSNGYIYLSYVVDFHHLMHFGTPEYDSQADEYFRDTIGRVTRYTCDASTDFQTIVPGSRQVLIGENVSSGIPILNQSHGIGTICFGEDGTLLVGAGESASYDVIDTGGPVGGSSNTGLTDGIISPKEDIGALRAQLVDSLSGKILRIDPATGDGLPSNPFFDASNARAARSRVWAMGFRNPYRFRLRPGSGNSDPAAGDPGTLYVGDVGWADWEELNTCTAGGQNFGWPLFEGYEPSDYFGTNVANLDAPNPLAGQNGCPAHFTFEDLLVQEALPASWPNPCDAGQQVPPEVPHFMHRRPAVDYFHRVFEGPSRTGTFNAGVAGTIRLDDPNSPVPGPNFGGNAAVAGVWYNGSAFPNEYQNTYFHGDYAHGWIRNFSFDAADNPTAARDFATERGYVLDFAINPVDDAVYYVAINQFGVAAVHRLHWVDNLPPIVAAAPEVSNGPLPLTVAFSSAGTSDPESGPLTYTWDFGDGSPPSYEANPTHTYLSLGYVDVSNAGTIIARVFELVPPGSQSDARFPEVIRDGDMPPVGNLDSSRHYETYHFGDQDNFDWIGYEFGTPQEFQALVFQEGKHNWNGGWFDTMGVEVLVDGIWQPVANLAVSPVYLGDNTNDFSYERFSFTFDPVVGTAIRLVGDPGGVHNYITVGELRAYATGSTPITAPTRYDVTLSVKDNLRNVVSRQLLVSANNTPPVVQILTPQNNSTYSIEQVQFHTLTADITDAEHSAGELSCSWLTEFHHDDHVHIEPLDTDCATEGRTDPVGCGSEVYFYSFRLTVTDAAGLSGSQEVRIFPACCAGIGCEVADLSAPKDCLVDLYDLTILLSNFGLHGLNIPGDIQAPWDEVDLTDLTTMLTHFGSDCR